MLLTSTNAQSFLGMPGLTIGIKKMLCCNMTRALLYHDHIHVCEEKKMIKKPNRKWKILIEFTSKNRPAVPHITFHRSVKKKQHPRNDKSSVSTATSEQIFSHIANDCVDRCYSNLFVRIKFLALQFKSNIKCDSINNGSKYARMNNHTSPHNSPFRNSLCPFPEKIQIWTNS